MAVVESTNTSIPAPPVHGESADAGLSVMVTSSHQVQQATHPRVVWIHLLHLDAAHKKPGTNSCGGTRILVCYQIPVHLASGMYWLVCVSVSMSYPACTPFLGKYSV